MYNEQLRMITLFPVTIITKIFFFNLHDVKTVGGASRRTLATTTVFITVRRLKNKMSVFTITLLF